MKNVTMALAVLVVLTGVSAARAVVTMTACRVGEPAPGLETWIIRTCGTNAFRDIVIDGPVHQGNMKFGTFIPASIYGPDMPNNGASPAVIAADTHFLFSANDILIGNGAAVETNDGTNPAGLPDTGGSQMFGLGTFGGDLAFSFKTDDVLTGVDIMQVVIPAGTMFLATAMAVDAAAPDQPWVPVEMSFWYGGDPTGDGKIDLSDLSVLGSHWHQPVSGLSEGDFNGDFYVDLSDLSILSSNWGHGVYTEAAAVPEPSTVVMLILGALCLAGYRLRK